MADLTEAQSIIKRLSEALIKVRPLGGSELFIRHGDDFVADPEFCGREIERIRQENIDLKMENVRLRRALSQPQPVEDRP